MPASDPAPASDTPQPPADAITEAKPTAMLAFMEEMRQHMQNQDRQITALQQAVSVRAAPAGDNGAGTNDAVAPVGPPVSRETVQNHPTRDRGFRGAGCAIAHPENPEGVQTPIFAHPQFVVGAHAALALECPKPILEGPSASLMVPHRCLKA